MAKQFNIGDITTVQLGNPSDTYGYREHAPCKVLAVRDNFGQAFYLLQILDEEGYYADACVYPRQVQGELYSTVGRRIGKNGLETFKDIAYHLGYQQ